MRRTRSRSAARHCLSLTGDDRTALLCACFTHGLVQHLRGRPRIAREWFEKASVAYDGLDESDMHALSVADPGVIILGLLAMDLLHLGLDRSGTCARFTRRTRRARELRAPGPQMAALWLEALFEVPTWQCAARRRDRRELQALDEECSLAHARAACASVVSRLGAGTLGDPRGGHALIREGYALAVQIGTRAWASETLGYAAEALVLARRLGLRPASSSTKRCSARMRSGNASICPNCCCSMPVSPTRLATPDHAANHGVRPVPRRALRKPYGLS